MPIDYNTKLLLHLNDDWTDSSTYGHDVDTVSGAIISTTVKKFGAGSGYFDRINDYARINHHSDFNFGTGEFTIEFFLRYNNTVQTFDVSFGKLQPSSWGDGWGFWWDGTYNIRFMCPWGTDAYSSTAFGGFSKGVWYHVAAVRVGSTITLYRDGVAGNVTVSKGTSIDTTRNINIGYDGSGYYSEMNIDEIRISNVARYTSNFTPPVAEFDIGSEGGLLIHPGMGGGMRSLCGGFRA